MPTGVPRRGVEYVEGTPCRVCGETLRYAKHLKCVACRRRKQAAEYAAGRRPKASREVMRRAQRAYQARVDIRAARADRERARAARKRGQFVEHVDRLVLLERSDGACGICGGDVDPLNFHVDHVVPLARGGGHSYDNVQVAHPVCNTRKGVRLV